MVSKRAEPRSPTAQMRKIKPFKKYFGTRSESMTIVVSHYPKSY